jgi:hypothetical protein
MPVGAGIPSRFDIAMLHKRGVDVTDGVTPANGTRFTAIEIGYRSDYDPELKKLAEKQLQHMPTCQALAQHYNVDYQVWDIGHTGMIPKRLLTMPCYPSRGQQCRQTIERVTHHSCSTCDVHHTRQAG